VPPAIGSKNFPGGGDFSSPVSRDVLAWQSRADVQSAPENGAFYGGTLREDAGRRTEKR